MLCSALILFVFSCISLFMLYKTIAILDELQEYKYSDAYQFYDKIKTAQVVVTAAAIVATVLLSVLTENNILVVCILAGLLLVGIISYIITNFKGTFTEKIKQWWRMGN